MPSATSTSDSAAGSADHSNILRKNWVYVMAPKNRQWTTAMDGIDKLKLNEADIPSPNDGEVLVKITAVSLNYRDIEVCDGVFNHYNTQSSQAIVPCSDMCGIVVDASKSRGGRFENGARVMAIYLQSHLHGPVQEADMDSGLGLPQPGVLAQYRCFPAESLVAVPDYLSDQEASCLPLATTTAWTALNWMRPLVATTAGTNAVMGGSSDGDGDSSKKTVLLQGTTAVALAGLQIAKAAGLCAVITASTDEHVARATDELGADHGINYQTHWAWEGEVLGATGDRGADIIFDTGGGARTLQKSFKCVAFGGLINCIGSLSGRTDDGDDGGGGGGGGGGGDDGKTPKLHRLNVNALVLARNVTIKGVLNGSRDRLEEALAFYDKRQIRPVIDKTFSFAEAGDALAYMKKGKHFGKVVITVEDEPDDNDGDDGGGDGGEEKPKE